MKPTPEQRAVIETLNQTLIVEAGAGTGKTWALVRRFIHLLETHADWPLESIVAITFTTKAAREMRGRIRDAIEEKARDNPDDFRWQEHRRNLDRMQISTIHSLCARILRENAIAAQIDPQFEVLDEQQADLLREAAADETIRRMAQEHHPALALLESLRVYELRAEMLNLLSQRGVLRLLFEGLPGEEALLDRWRDGLAEMRVSLWGQALDGNEALSAALKELPLVEIIDPADKLADAVKLAQQGCAAYFGGDEMGAFSQWCAIDLRGGKQGNWGGKESLGDLKGLLRSLREMAQLIEKSGALQGIGEYDQQAAHHLQLWRQLWDLLNGVYDALKEEQQGLDFDDLEYYTVRLLQTQPRPERLQAFYEGAHHLMVDEFQDTNPVQMQIVTALAPIADPGRLFTVGDAKQSIYRFRQAQVSLFNQTAAAIQTASGQPPLPLSTSFRTHQRLVSALNDLFDVIFLPEQGKEHRDFEARPGPLTAHRQGGRAPEPCVELLLLPNKDVADKTISTEEARIAEARWIAQRIRQLSDEQAPVWDKEQGNYRAFIFQDAAVLFRATTSLPLYEAEFKAAGLPYMTVSGRGYYDRPEVQDLVSLLSALLNPHDDLSLAAALRSPLFSLSDETLYRLRRFNPEGEPVEESIPYQAALNQPPPNDQVDWVNRAALILNDLWVLAGHCNVWWLLRQALDRTGFETTLAINDAHSGRQLVNVQKFLAQARGQLDLSLGDFLAQLQDLQAREAREGEAPGREPASGAVQLMSIHAAKGLEFPAVFVADLGRRKRSGFDTPYLLHDPVFGMACKVRDENGDWVKPVPGGYGWAKWVNESMEAAEDKRLLYVACTRAADRLFLSGRLGEKSSWLTQILDAWQVSDDGEADQVLPYKGFSLRVFKPDSLPEPFPPRQPSAIAAFKLDQVPDLAEPFAQYRGVKTLGTTDFVEMMVADSTLTHKIRPAVWDDRQQQSKVHVPGYLLGKIVHHTLSHGFFDPQDNKALTDKLASYGRQEGLAGEKLHRAISRASRMLMQLKQHRLFEDIASAQQCLHEMPFNWRSSMGHLHGVIDIFYQDQEGDWHLLDWKTEYVTDDSLEAFTHNHILQMSVYTHAMGDILGVKPAAALVCLQPVMRVVALSAEMLEDQWRLIGG